MISIPVFPRNLHGVLLVLVSGLIVALSTYSAVYAPDHGIIQTVFSAGVVPDTPFQIKPVNNAVLPAGYQGNAINPSFSSGFSLLLEQQRVIIWNYLGRYVPRFIKRASDGAFSSHGRHNGANLYEDSFTPHSGFSADNKQYGLSTSHNKSQVQWQALYASLVKRADVPEAYTKALCHGKNLWAEVQFAFDGRKDPGEVFRYSDLDNGWEESINETRALEPPWEEYFNLELGRERPSRMIPAKEKIAYIELIQSDDDFINRRGQTMVPANAYEDAINYSYNIPTISAIVVKNMVSPANVLTKFLIREKQPVPSSEEMKQRLIPPLSRWSDIAWTVDSEVARRTQGAEAKRLQYIGHDKVTNSGTNAITIYLFRKYWGDRPGRPNFQFPGLELDIKSADALALLKTPNRASTARLMIDRAREMGRRSLKIRIWQTGTNRIFYFMGFNMVHTSMP
ncbi:MAG: hypothetical protein Q9213_006801 [Squamulea squamosa]